MSKEQEEDFDVLDMHNYRMEKLPVRDNSKFEKNMMKVGAPIAIIFFLIIMFFLEMPF